jgi:hypothetical protein
VNSYRLLVRDSLAFTAKAGDVMVG